jgi:glucose-6-phosphate 1-epimerase
MLSLSYTWGKNVLMMLQNFGPAPKDHATSALPQHGLARNTRWEFLGKSSSEGESAKGSDGSVKLDFGLYSSALPESLQKAWAYDFGLVYSVTLSKEGLQTAMQVRNEGKESFEFQLLLHTYLRIQVRSSLATNINDHANIPHQDISTTKVTGLASATYTDKVLDAKQFTQNTPEVSITGEVDRVYHSLKQSTTSVTAAGKPRFDVVRDNLTDTVVWNPWIEKAKGMGDFEPKDGYKNMICVEAGSVTEWTKLDAGEGWEGGQIIKSLL